MLGLGKAAQKTQNATLSQDMGKNGPRAHYMRAVTHIENGHLLVKAFERQDSSLLSVLSQANALIVREPLDPAVSAGQTVRIIPL